MSVSSFVESIEFADVTISSSATTYGYNLTKGQNYANCVPFFSSYSDTDYHDDRFVDLYFSGTTESGVLNFHRYNKRTTSLYIKCYVVEFNPEQVRVQQGSFDLAGLTTQTVTLPTTLSGTDRAAMTFGSLNGDGQATQAFVKAMIVSTSGINFYRCSSAGVCNGHWFLFEDLGNNFRCYHNSGSWGYGGDVTSIVKSNNQCFDPLRTFVIGSHAASGDGGNNAYCCAKINLENDIFVRGVCFLNSYSNIYWATQVIEFLDTTKVYIPFSLGSRGISASTTTFNVGGENSYFTTFYCNTETTTMVMAAFQGNAATWDRTGSNRNECFCSVELTSSGVITVRKSGSSIGIYTSDIAAIDWAGIEVNTGTNSNPIPEGNGAGQSFVKSVENFRFTMYNDTGFRALTKGQNASNCIAFSSYRSSYDNDYIYDIVASVSIDSTGVVCIKRSVPTDSGYGAYGVNAYLYVDVSVVEFYPSQVKVQQGVVAVTSTSTVSKTITTLSSINKAFIISSFSGSYVSFFSGSTCRVHFSDSSTVQIYEAMNSYTKCVFFVAEDIGNNFVTRHYLATTDTTNLPFTNVDYSWDEFNTFPIVSYAGGSTAANNGCVRAYHQLSSCIPVNVDKSATGTLYYYLSAIKFLDDKMHCSRLLHTLNAVSSYTGYYDSIFRDNENITLYTVTQNSCCRVDTTAGAAVSDAFATIRVINYETGEYEVSKSTSAYTSYVGAQLIDWVGYTTTTSTSDCVPTRSFVKSIQKNYINTSTYYYIVYVALEYNQKIDKCVPFITCDARVSDGIVSRLFKTIHAVIPHNKFKLYSYYSPTSSTSSMLYIVEFNDDITVQSGYIGSTGTSVTVTINEVNLDRAFLHFFFEGSSSEIVGRGSTVCGRFTSSTQIEFIRKYATGYIAISWYVVECPDWGDDSYWRVLHQYRTGLGSGAVVNISMDNRPLIYRSLYLVSYASDATSGGPGYGSYTAYVTANPGVEVALVKGTAGGGSIQNCNVEAIEFSPKLVNNGLKICNSMYTLYNTSSLDVSLGLPTGENLHIYRSILMNVVEGGSCRVDTSSNNGWTEANHYLTFKDSDGDGYSDTITASKGTNSYYSYNYFSAIQFPDYNKYYFEGYVTELDIYVSRTIRAYKSSSGKLVDETVSVSGTGYFLLETPDYEAHYLVALDDVGGVSYNHIIYSNVYPTIISGSFAYKMGLVTVSGVEEGIPLLYQ